MYDDLDLDYTCEDNSFNLDDEWEDLDENYQREHIYYCDFIKISTRYVSNYTHKH